jgi:hypothetical protein
MLPAIAHIVAVFVPERLNGGSVAFRFDPPPPGLGRKRTMCGTSQSLGHEWLPEFLWTTMGAGIPCETTEGGFAPS